MTEHEKKMLCIDLMVKAVEANPLLTYSNKEIQEGADVIYNYIFGKTDSR
jgi:hypothetical protein